MTSPNDNNHEIVAKSKSTRDDLGVAAAIIFAGCVLSFVPEHAGIDWMFGGCFIASIVINGTLVLRDRLKYAVSLVDGFNDQFTLPAEPVENRNSHTQPC